MKTLGFRLVEARKNFGLTQKQVAERLLITTQAISSWESGNSVPDIEKIPEIASLYGVTTDWLLSGKEPSEEILEVTSNLLRPAFQRGPDGDVCQRVLQREAVISDEKGTGICQGKAQRPVPEDRSWRGKSSIYLSSSLAYLPCACAGTGRG